MLATQTIQLFDGVKVVAPDSLNLLTPYVLLEQEDWFEDEIKFVRQLLAPGQQIIDIGANVGVYTLPMANAVGPKGHVWAFEPASGTADLLAQGIAANGFAWVDLERCALSSASGSAQLILNEQSEFNSLQLGAAASGTTELVQLRTLDECKQKYGWTDIDFMKIDAEGEEVKILKGGAQFFKSCSPLVQYELKIEADLLNMGLVHDFAALGYDSYRLVPGLGMLAPFSFELAADGYLLNLFCCKPDRAEQLAANGLLAPACTAFEGEKSTRQEALLAKIKLTDTYGWRHTIAQMPYGSSLTHQWVEHSPQAGHAELIDALALYAFSQAPAATPLERLDALDLSFNMLLALCAKHPTDTRLISLARVAQAFGARSQAIGALEIVRANLAQNKSSDLSEPFVAPMARFDAISPGDSVGNWLLAAVLESFEQVVHFSSYYTGIESHKRLVQIKALGFGSDEMSRRLNMVCKRFNMPSLALPAFLLKRQV
jgi:FkbM family methyltransferase